MNSVDILVNLTKKFNIMRHSGKMNTKIKKAFKKGY